MRIIKMYKLGASISISMIFICLVNIDSASQTIIIESYLRNKYVARGIVGSNSPTAETNLTVNFPGLGLGIWGISSINNYYSEIDLFGEYTIGNFNVSVIDYYSPNPQKGICYFNLKHYKSIHTLDIVLSYMLPGIPLRIKWSSYILGSDFDLKSKKRMYSSYFELSYSKHLLHFDSRLIIGIVPWKSWNSDKLTVVNCGLSIEENVFTYKNSSLPIALNFIFNPSIRQFNFSMIVGLKNKSTCC